jgi:hypothetical protein
MARLASSGNDRPTRLELRFYRVVVAVTGPATERADRIRAKVAEYLHSDETAAGLLPPGSAVLLPDEVEQVLRLIDADCHDAARALLGGTDQPDARTLGERAEVKGATWESIQ